jgi:hypothetical protein
METVEADAIADRGTAGVIIRFLAGSEDASRRGMGDKASALSSPSLESRELIEEWPYGRISNIL